MGERIIELFNSGKKMIDISRELNIPYNTVKSIVRRKNESEKKVEPINKNINSNVNENINVCLCCGKDIKLIEGKKKRIFCSSNCRVKYWRLKNGK